MPTNTKRKSTNTDKEPKNAKPKSTRVEEKVNKSPKNRRSKPVENPKDDLIIQHDPNDCPLFENNIKVGEAFVCKMCEKVFFQEKSLTSHMQNHMLCVYCKKKFHTFDDVSEHSAVCLWKKCLIESPELFIDNIAMSKLLRQKHKAAFRKWPFLNVDRLKSAFLHNKNGYEKTIIENCRSIMLKEEDTNLESLETVNVDSVQLDQNKFRTSSKLSPTLKGNTRSTVFHNSEIILSPVSKNMSNTRLSQEVSLLVKETETSKNQEPLLTIIIDEDDKQPLNDKADAPSLNELYPLIVIDDDYTTDAELQNPNNVTKVTGENEAIANVSFQKTKKITHRRKTVTHSSPKTSDECLKVRKNELATEIIALDESLSEQRETNQTSPKMRKRLKDNSIIQPVFGPSLSKLYPVIVIGDDENSSENDKLNKRVIKNINKISTPRMSIEPREDGKNNKTKALVSENSLSKNLGDLKFDNVNNITEKECSTSHSFSQRPSKLSAEQTEKRRNSLKSKIKLLHDQVVSPWNGSFPLIVIDDDADVTKELDLPSFSTVSTGKNNDAVLNNVDNVLSKQTENVTPKRKNVNTSYSLNTRIKEGDQTNISLPERCLSNELFLHSSRKTLEERERSNLTHLNEDKLNTADMEKLFGGKIRKTTNGKKPEVPFKLKIRLKNDQIINPSVPLSNELCTPIVIDKLDITKDLRNSTVSTEKVEIVDNNEAVANHGDISSVETKNVTPETEKQIITRRMSAKLKDNSKKTTLASNASSPIAKECPPSHTLKDHQNLKNELKTKTKESDLENSNTSTTVTSKTAVSNRAELSIKEKQNLTKEKKNVVMTRQMSLKLKEDIENNQTESSVHSSKTLISPTSNKILAVSDEKENLQRTPTTLRSSRKVPSTQNKTELNAKRKRESSDIQNDMKKRCEIFENNKVIDTPTSRENNDHTNVLPSIVIKITKNISTNQSIKTKYSITNKQGVNKIADEEINSPITQKERTSSRASAQLSKKTKLQRLTKNKLTKPKTKAKSLDENNINKAKNQTSASAPLSKKIGLQPLTNGNAAKSILPKPCTPERNAKSVDKNIDSINKTKNHTTKTIVQRKKEQPSINQRKRSEPINKSANVSQLPKTKNVNNKANKPIFVPTKLTRQRTRNKWRNINSFLDSTKSHFLGFNSPKHFDEISKDQFMFYNQLEPAVRQLTYEQRLDDNETEHKPNNVEMECNNQSPTDRRSSVSEAKSSNSSTYINYTNTPNSNIFSWGNW